MSMKSCTTIGELKSAIAELPDEAPLRISYDGGAGGASSVAVYGLATEDSEQFDPWSRKGDAMLSIDYDPNKAESLGATLAAYSALGEQAKDEQRRAFANASANLIALIELVTHAPGQRAEMEKRAHDTLRWIAHFIGATQAAGEMVV